MHVRKFDWSEAPHMVTHYERGAFTYSNSEIQSEYTELNYNIAPERFGQCDYIRRMLDNIDHVKRKDLIVMADWVVQVPYDLDPELYDKFFRLTYEFFNARYGKKAGFEGHEEDICISCYAHLDEKTPHIHYSFLPIYFDDKQNKSRFLAKKVIDQNELKTVHTDLQAYVNDNGCRCTLLTGATKRDSSGRALSVAELKRQDFYMKQREERDRQERTRF